MFGIPNSSYVTGPPPRETHRVTTSLTEILHLSVAFVVLTVDITLIQLRLGLSTFVFTPADLLLAGGFAAAATFTGFLAHELAHKITAQRLGLWAEFRASPLGLLLSFVFSAVIGFLLAAPGATMVDGFGDLKDWGKISIAGPGVNMAFGAVFLAGAEVASGQPGLSTWTVYLGLLAFFNGWFGTFNLIPVGPLDGRKVLRWSPYLWAGAIVFAALITIIAYSLLFLPGTL